MLWAACSTSVDDGLLGVVTSTISTSIWAAFAIAGDEEKSIKSSSSACTESCIEDSNGEVVWRAMG